MPKMPGGDEKKEESAESKEEAAEQVRIYVESVLGCRVGQSCVMPRSRSFCV